MTTSSLPALLVVDANVLLSALIGGRARDILLVEEVASFATTEQTIDEVREYLRRLATKYHLDLQLLSAALVTLPLEVHARQFYTSFLQESSDRIAQRDPDDVDLLALALRLKAPIWTNDRDFRDCGVELWTTAQLLASLEHRP